MDKPALRFHDVIRILKDAEGTLIGISVAPDMRELEWANVVQFDGILADVDENIRPGAILLRILSASGARAGWIDLSRTRFRGATLDDDDDPPQTLTVWQRGMRLQLRLWPPGTSRAGLEEASAGPGEASADDIPF